MKRSRWNALAGVALFACIAVLALFAQWAEPSSAPDSESARNNGASGRRALFLLLEELGRHPEIWSGTPAKLPRGQHVLWLARGPRHFLAGSDENRANEHGPSEHGANEHGATDHGASEPTIDGLGRHALVHYKRFVEEGGTLVVPWDDDAKEFLTSVLVLREFASMSTVASDAGSILAVRTSSGETCEVEGDLLPTFEGLDPNSDLLPIWMVERASGEERVAAVELPLGAGNLVVIAGDGWISNSQIGEHDHALLAVRSIDELDRGGRILFDEYALGGWTPDTFADLATSASFLPLSLHLLLLCALFVWSAAWTGPFARDMRRHEERSALSRARALASLFERAGRRSILARWLRDGIVRGRSARAARAPRATERTDRTEKTAAKDDVEAWLAALSAHHAPEPERWREALARAPIRTREDLDRLGRDLDDLELRWKERGSDGILLLRGTRAQGGAPLAPRTSAVDATQGPEHLTKTRR